MYSLIFDVFILITNITNIKSQVCNSDTYTITDNSNTTLLTLDKYGNLNITGNIINNGYCKCNSFVGDGSTLNNLNNNTVIANLITQISNMTYLLNQITSLQNQIVYLNQTITCRYINIANTSFLNKTDQNIPYPTKDYDSHGAYNGSVFTAPISGKYRLTYSFFGMVNLANYQGMIYGYKKNLGSPIYNAVQYGTGFLGNMFLHYTVELSLNTNDTLEARCTSEVPFTLGNVPDYNAITITKIGD